MKTTDMMVVLLASLDVANATLRKAEQDHAWKVVEIRDDQFVVRHLESGKKFRIKVKEEP